MRIQVFLKNLENEILKHFLVRNGKIFMKENPKAVTVLVTIIPLILYDLMDCLVGRTIARKLLPVKRVKGAPVAPLKPQLSYQLIYQRPYIYIYSRSILPIEIPNLKIQKHFHYPLFFIPHVFRH